MVDLPETSSAVIRALLGAPVAWQMLEELAATLGWDVGTTTDVLASLDADGWLGVWERAEGIAVTLSPLGAERLGVRLSEFSPPEAPRWIPIDAPEAQPPRPKRVGSHAGRAVLQFIADPHIPPDLATQEAERLAAMMPRPPVPRRYRFRSAEEPPRPTLLLGLSLTPWPGPRRDPDSPCPACGSMVLLPHMYCLCCDRWGLDDLVPGTRPAQGPYGEAASPAEQQHDREIRAHRRARLRARLVEENRADRLARRRNGTNGPSGPPLAGSGPPGVT